MSKELVQDQRISEALELLNATAKEKGEDFTKLISNKYDHLKTAVTQNLHASEKFIKNESKYMMRTAKRAASTLDESVQEHPWKFIGGAAVGGLVLGALLTRTRR